MATYQATLYLLGQSPRSLTTLEVAALQPNPYELNERLYLQADMNRVNALLGTQEAEPIASTGSGVLYGIFDVPDEAEVNTTAEAATLRLFNVGDLLGPLLILEEVA